MAHPARHPSPTSRAAAPADLVSGRADLELAQRFLSDFGLLVAHHTDDVLCLRGAALAPYCDRVHRAPGARLVGAGSSVATRGDLERLAGIEGASAIATGAHPGAGEDVTRHHPSGARSLLLTGATGFVGGAVRPAIEARGWRVRCLTRDAAQARRCEPAVDWVEGDVGDPASMAAALKGCAAALYLVHGIGEGADYHRQEVLAASTFSNAAAAAGVERIAYLGGVSPSGAGSEHLRSRLDVGEALRAGSVKTIELRASMIVGHGSLSWLIVRDLAARLPVMVLPQWLKSRTQPVAIDDVVIALVRALELPLAASACFDVPGPDTLSGKEILEETARVLGLTHPRMLEVPLLSPRLSSLWVRFVTRARWSVAREVVVGLTEDLLARDDRLWHLIEHPKRLSFAEAARRAVDADRRQGPVPGAWGAIERLRGLSKGSP